MLHAPEAESLLNTMESTYVFPAASVQMSLSSTPRVVASAAALATGLVAVVAWSRRRGRTPSLPNLICNLSEVIRDRLFNEGPRLQQAMGYEKMRARQNSLANLLPDDELVKIFADLAGEE